MSAFELTEIVPVLQSTIDELKRLQREIDEADAYSRWYTTEAWSKEMTTDEEKKGDDLYDRSCNNTKRIAEIIREL